MVRTSKLQKDFKKNHIEKRKMLLDRNQGVFLEDILENNQKFRATGIYSSMLPMIGPKTTTNVTVKKDLHHGSKRGLKLKIASQLQNP